MANKENTVSFDNTKRNESLAQSLLARFESLKNIREKIDPLRWEAFAYANHRTKASSISDSPVPEINRYSTVGEIAIENFINGFMGNLVSQNQNWASFRYESKDFTDQDDMVGANDFLGLVQKRTMSELANSNFYAQDRLAAKDAFIGACSATFVHNDPEQDICVFDTIEPWNWWCDKNANGVYDTFFYKKRMSAYRAYEVFGDKLDEEIIKVAKNDKGSSEYYDFLLCIYPRNSVFVGTNIFPKKKNYASVWLSLSRVGNKGTVLTESGYDMFPVIIHCWDSDGDNPYGTSPVIRALPDLRRLNMLAYESGLSLAKINHSPYVMTSAVEERFSDDPSSHIIVPSMEQAPIPLQQGQALDGALEAFQRQSEYIQRLFYNDMFNYLSRQDKVFTATQVNAVKSEELTLLSAIFGNVQTQKIDKMIKLVVFIMGENKRLPQGVKEAFKKGGKLKVVLDSMLAQSLRSYTYRDSGLANLELLERCAAITRVYPDAMKMIDNMNLNNIARGIMNGNGSDPSYLVDKAIVSQIQQTRQQMQIQQMQQQQAMQESEMVRNMGGASNMNNSTGANQYQ